MDTTNDASPMLTGEGVSKEVEFFTSHGDLLENACFNSQFPATSNTSILCQESSAPTCFVDVVKYFIYQLDWQIGHDRLKITESFEIWSTIGNATVHQLPRILGSK